jgi:trimethylguanosine synthase
MPSVEWEEMQLRLQHLVKGVRLSSARFISYLSFVCPSMYNCHLKLSSNPVIAIDTSPIRLSLARHNAAIYGVADRIEFILADYISFAQSFIASQREGKERKIDVVFLSPPWGGPEYINGNGNSGPTDLLPNSSTPVTPVPTEHPEYSLSSIQPIHGAELWRISRQITKNVAYYLPRNTKLEEVAALLDDDALVSGGNGGTIDGEKVEKVKEGEAQKNSTKPWDDIVSSTENTLGTVKREMVEVEEEWMGVNLKALTCYFGGLVSGQEEMF